MFRHLLKLIWKRKTRNMMLSLEILLAFVIVFTIAAFAARNYQEYRLPTGFSYQDRWSIDLRPPTPLKSKEDYAVFDNFKRSLLALPEVEGLAFTSVSPYTHATRTTIFGLPDGGAKFESYVSDVSDDFFQTTDMTLEEGRWFSEADEGAANGPVVVNRRIAREMFPGQSPIGKLIGDGEPGSKERKLFKIVGVVNEYRQRGELMEPVNFVFQRFSALSAQGDAEAAILKLKPGTPRTFESKLSAQLKLIRPDWSYQISPLSVQRESMLRTQLTPLVVLSVIAVFLLLMVGFGLFGVLWQNTTQRIPEIGLRRAVGADSGQIYRQIVAEQMLLSSVAMLIGLVLLVQLPLTNVFGESLNWSVFVAAAGMAMAVIYLLSLLCALYPGWRASRLSPTEALHYE